MSGGGAYRDGDAALRERLADLRAIVRDRELAIPPGVVPFLPESLRAALAQGEASLAEVPKDAEAIHRVVALIDEYRAQLDEAIALVPQLERSMRRIPNVAPEPPKIYDGVLTTPFFRVTDVAPSLKAFTRLVRGLDAHAKVEHVESSELLAKLNVDSVPYALRFAISPNAVQRVHTGFFASWETTMPLLGTWVLATSAAQAAPRVKLRPETAIHLVGKLLNVVHEVEVDDLDLDGTFLIEGDAATLKAALRGPLRRALLGVAHYDVPEVTLGDGQCVMRWEQETTSALLRHAIVALRYLRALGVPGPR